MKRGLDSPSPASTAGAGALVELERVTVASGNDPAAAILEDVNWWVRPGEFWVVAGSPGCGKSRLLATAAGFERPLSGTQRLLGLEVSRLSPTDWRTVRERVGFVFAGGGRLFQHFTVAQNLGLPLCYRLGCPPAEITPRLEALLEAMDLVAWADWAPARLTRPVRQRTALARALTIEPDLLFLDDPLNGLDTRQTRWWLERLARLRRGAPESGGRPITLVVATDDPRPWRTVATEFALISEARWVPIGGPAEFAECAEPWLREILAPPGAGH